jgi:hypothetical protein
MQEALVYAIGIAISPIAIAATLLLLTCRRAVANVISFLVGWTVGVAVVIVLFIVLVNSVSLSDSDPVWIALTELAIGAGFLLAVAAVWRNRHERQSGSHSWVAAVDSFTTARSAGLGVVLSGANPKVVALSLGAALSLAQAEASAAVTAETLVLYCAIGAAGVLVPLSVYLTMPGHASSLLAAFRVRLVRHETAILMALGLVISAAFLSDGLDGL